MKLQLRQYQIECLRFLLKWRGRAVIGDAPGLGKTAEGLSWLTNNPAHLPTLIICTATTKYQWLNNWNDWIGKNVPVKILNGTTPHRLKENTSYIINWDILYYWYPYIPKTIKTIIADECHHVGNSKAKRTRALSWLSKYSPYFIGMSGTPIRSKPGQFFPILHMIDPDFFPSEIDFQYKYCNMGLNYKGFRVEKPGGKNLGELNLVLSDYMIRREKVNLPARQRSVIPLDIQNKTEYEKLEKQARNIAYQSNTFTGGNALRNLKRSTFIFKKDSVISWIEDYLESEESLIVFAYHKAVLSCLEQHFKNKCVRVDGGITGNRRINALNLFTKKKKQLLIGQIDAMGEAIDGLQHICNACAFVEFGTTATAHDQAESRLDRSGQTRGVNCYYLVARGTLDEDQMYVLDEQTKMLNKILKGKTVTADTDLLTAVYHNWRKQNG